MTNQDQNSMNTGVGGTSYIYDYGTSPNTRIAVSQKSRVMTPHYGSNSALHQVGVLGNFSVNQSKNVENYRGIGFGDKIAELVPGVTEPTTIDFERALMYLSNIWQSLGYAAGVDGPVRSLAHHKWPFDMEHQLVFSSLADQDLATSGVAFSGDSGSFKGGVKGVSYPQPTLDVLGHPSEALQHTAIITIYEACWLTSWSVPYQKDSATVLENANAMVSDVHDFSSTYGEFMATGNDPTIGQLGSLRFGGTNIPQAGGGAGVNVNL